jgi:pimeloyl-ACP methyl ester carboxylesterase
MTAPFVVRTYKSFDGLQLHFRDYAGPAHAPFTVVCVHGMTSTARTFEDLAIHLSARYRVLCVDLRGRGASQFAHDPMTYVPLSYVRDLEALFDQTGIAHAAVIGTSLGGLVGCLFSAVMPEKVLGLIMNDVGTEVDPTGLARIGQLVANPFRPANWDEAAARVKAGDGAFFPEHTDGDWMRMARRRYVEVPGGGLRQDYDPKIAVTFTLPVTTPDLWPFFRRLSATPTMVIRGERSDVLSRANMLQMKDVLPTLETVEVPVRAHAPNLAEPVALTAIDKFLGALPHWPGITKKTIGRLAARRFFSKQQRAGVF